MRSRSRRRCRHHGRGARPLSWHRHRVDEHQGCARRRVRPRGRRSLHYYAGRADTAVEKLLRATASVLPGWSKCLRHTAPRSGRKMIADVFQADAHVDEITAHATAARLLYPDVDTIIEIGDRTRSSLASRRPVVYSAMNYVCAAGTGSFIEEQARRLGVTLSELSELAIGRAAPTPAIAVPSTWSAISMSWQGRDGRASPFSPRSSSRYGTTTLPRWWAGMPSAPTSSSRARPPATEPWSRPSSSTRHARARLSVLPPCWSNRCGAAAREEGPHAVPSHRRSRPRHRRRGLHAVTNHCALTCEDGFRHHGWGMKCGREYGERRGGKQRSITQSRSASPGVRSPPAAATSPLTPPGCRGGRLATADHRACPGSLPPGLQSRLARLPHATGFDVVSPRTARSTLPRENPWWTRIFVPINLAHGAMKDLHDRESMPSSSPPPRRGGSGGSSRIPLRSKTTDSYLCYYSSTHHHLAQPDSPATG